MDEKKGIDINILAERLESQQVNIKGLQFNLLQIIVFAGAIAQLIASLLPMFSVNVWGYSASISFIEGDGIVALLLVIATCVCTYLNKKQIALGLAAANICLIVYDCFLGGANTYGLVKLSVGGYLLMIVGIVVVLSCALSYVHSKNQ